MADLVLVSIMLAFILVCVAYVAWCDHIIGADDSSVVTSAASTSQAPASVVASAEPASVNA